MTGKLSGKAAVVTGGTANIGRLFAGALADDGADVLVHYTARAARTRPRRSSAS
jgi:NAD(P)-dependent dehydrogenase (short-subunit alcohol dehydrogenase family)